MQLSLISLRAGFASLICVLYFSGMGYAQLFEKKGNVITYRGNRFEMSDPIIDTITITDPVNGQEVVKTIKREPLPLKMNGQQIYNTEEVAITPQTYAQSGSIQSYLFKNLSGDLGKLPDGYYDMLLENIVFDEHGKIVFYHYPELSLFNHYDDGKLPADMLHAISLKLDGLLRDAPAVQPATYKNTAVKVRCNFMEPRTRFVVKNHKATLEEWR